MSTLLTGFDNRCSATNETKQPDITAMKYSSRPLSGAIQNLP